MCDGCILQPIKFHLFQSISSFRRANSSTGISLSSARRQENAYRCNALNSVIFTAVGGEYPE